MLSTFWTINLLAAAAMAQSGETGPNNGTTPTIIEDEITVHIVTVGDITDAYQPNSINANPGDKVMFKFWPGNHSVIESLYGWPCVPRESVTGQQGFYSGGFPDTTPENPQSWNLTITDTSTIFYYCGAPGSCINYGMLGVINPSNATNLTAQIEIAKASRYYLEPNETMPQDAAASISALAAPILAETNSGQDNDSNANHSGLSAGAIAGIVIGAVAGLAIIAALIFHIRRKKHQRRGENGTTQQQSAMQSPQPTPAMTFDGVPFVPAYDPNASAQKTGFLPPYQYAHDRRSPEPVYATPMHYQGHTAFGSPDTHSVSRFSETSELEHQAPQFRHELPGYQMPPVGE